ncbi:MAG: ATP-binding protein, partial [Chitinophagaceae bacterium]
ADSMIFIAEDITEKFKNDEEVSALKNLIDDTEDLLLFGSWSWNLKIDKVYWTDGMNKLLNYKKADVEAEVSNEFYMNHVSSQDAAALKDIMKKAIENKTDFEYKYTLITRKNEQKLVSTKGKIILSPAGEVTKVVGITRDITKQTKINKDLLHYQEMIMEKEEFLNQGSWETNIRDGFTNWSRGMYHLFGYDPAEYMGVLEINNQLHFKHMSETEIQRSKEDWNNIIENLDSYTREATIIAKDGVNKRLETYGKVIRDANGIAEKVIGTTRDVTRLREYERSLEEKIRELNRSNTELEEFAYIASHDLQEPLRKLTTFSERLQFKFQNALGKDGMLYLERIVAATANMRTLIDNLLEFSRTARSNKHFTNANLNDLLDGVKSDLELKIEETGAKIDTDTLPTLDVIPSQIKQLFDNLISNSIKFRNSDRKSTIVITCRKLSRPEINTYKLRPEKVYFMIAVEDNGIGFEKEYEERIFQIFQRLHGKSEYPGSGIGLAICKKIVDNHNGLIFASGKPGYGSVFTIILPENQS